MLAADSCWPMRAEPNTIHSPARAPRVAVITNIMPHYRCDFCRRVFGREVDDDLHPPTENEVA